MTKLSTEPYKGVRDFFPADWALLEAIFDVQKKVLHSWGYAAYNASPLERAEIYEAKTSEEIVNEQTYTFTDRGDRRVTLRPEMTPTLARMVAEKRRELALPLRWYSIGNRFRYERPQKGRLREFYQTDVDLLGVPEGEADIEIIRLVSELLKAFGAKDSDFTIRMNSRPLLNAACAAVGLKGEAVRAYLRLLDKKDKMDGETFVAASRALTERDPLALIENASEDPDTAREKRLVLDRIDSLKARGVENVVLDPSITRGFDYYTGMVFEVYDTDRENTRAMFGGGRYDHLLELFENESVPAVGFAIGEVTLTDFLTTHKILPPLNTNQPQLYLGTPSKSDIPGAQAFADTLRKEGGRIFVNLTERSLGDQIKDAVKRGIPLFMAYGAEEIGNQQARMKILSTGEEIAMALADLPAHLKSGS